MDAHTTGLVKRGLGPFNSRQLTLIACVAVVSAVVIIPTAAFAVVGSFSSNTAAPAVTGFNSSPAPNAVGALGVRAASETPRAFRRRRGRERHRRYRCSRKRSAMSAFSRTGHWVSAARTS